MTLPFHLMILDLPASLRDFDAEAATTTSGALKECFGDGDDPREWEDGTR